MAQSREFKRCVAKAFAHELRAARLAAGLRTYQLDTRAGLAERALRFLRLPAGGQISIPPNTALDVDGFMAGAGSRRDEPCARYGFLAGGVR